MPDRSSGELVVGDSRNAEVFFQSHLQPKDQIMVTVTSPPYWNLKDYGTAAQIGWRQGYGAYLDDCQSIFQQIFDRTHDAGALWVISDTLMDRTSVPRSLINIPNDLAARAATAGWTLREIFIWQKDRTIPYRSPGRLRNTFEYIHYFVKSERFRFYDDRLRDPVNLAGWWVQYPERYNPRGKAPTNVWTFPIPTQGAWSNGNVQHACPLPPDMVERMILLSSDEGDRVFDPFAGTGTVLSEARRLGRRPFGIELNPAYVDQYVRQMREAVISRTGEDPAVLAAKQANKLAGVIRRLRVVKYPKALAKLYAKAHELELEATALFVECSRFTPRPRAKLTVVVGNETSAAQRLALEAALGTLTSKYPLSQFQVDVEISVQAEQEFVAADMGKSIYVYEHGRTWTTAGRGNRAALLAIPRSSKVGRYLPIGSNIRLNETAHRPYA